MDYSARGLTREHAPELVRMVTDDALHNADYETPEVFAPLHAWRALGQMRADEAAEPLVALLRGRFEDDWLHEEVPTVLGMIGRAAIAPAQALLADAEAENSARIAAITTLEEVAARHPDLRNEAVALLAGQLQQYAEQDIDVNAFLVRALAELRATEAAPLIQAAYEADAVASFWVGDWEDMQVRMGLLAERITPRHRAIDPGPPSTPVQPTRQSPPRSSAKAKNRRKDAKAARKRNRRR